MALGAGAAAAILGVAVLVEPMLRVQTADPVADPVAEPVADPVALAVPAEPTPEVLPEVLPDVAPSMPAPVIDVVRIAPDGTGIVAGQAPAGTAVSVMLDDVLVAEAVADASGSFAAFVTLPPSAQPRTLSLIADPAGAAVGSDATVIVAPSPVPEPPQSAPEVEEPEVIAQADVVSDVPDAVPQELLPEVAPEIAQEIAPEPIPEATPEPVPESVAPDDVATVADAPATPGPAVAETQEAAPAEPLEIAEPVEIAETVAPEPVVPPPAQTGSSVQTEVSVSEPPPAALPDPAPELTDTVAALQPPSPDAPGIAPVLRLDEAGVRVLQPAIAPGATPVVLATVALDAIAYDAAGDVQLSGRAAGGGTVRIYVDNRLVIDVPVGADGQWASGLPDVPTGVYTMRVDQLDAGGAVVSRIETPFLREERATIAAAMVDQTDAPDFTVAVKTVQPGATLWAIARDQYGDGVMYVQVFEANRDRIRNPDLIYPGQVFVLPEIEKP